MKSTPDSLHDRPGAHDAGIPLGTVRAQGDVWTWSDSVYAMHGFAPGEVVPTADVMLAHCHPDDRARLAAVLVPDGTELSYAAEQYRLVDARGRERWVALTVDWSEPDACMYASMLDLTARHARASADAVTSMLTEALASRSTIDQAKGALEMVYGTDEATAFNLLKWYSQHANVKLRSVASDIVDSLSCTRSLPPDMKLFFDARMLRLGRTSDDPSEQDGATAGRRPAEITLRVDSDGDLVVVTGDIDQASIAAFAGALRSACDRSATGGGVVVDLTGCSHVGAAGITELASARRRLVGRSAAIRALVGDDLPDSAAVAAVVDTVVLPAGRTDMSTSSIREGRP